MTRKIKTLRSDADCSLIRQTPGSAGFQVWFRGKFVCFQMTLALANSLLDKLQADR